MRNYSNISQETTLAAGITAGDTAISVAAAVGYPSPPFAVALDPGALTEEVVLVTAAVGTTWTVTRGYDGTTAASHSAGVTVRHVQIAADLQEPQNHIANTSNPHATTAAQVGADASGTAAGLVATEATTRANADTALSTAITTHTGLTTTAHGGIVANTDPRLTDSRTPTAHASSHASAGSDPITIAESQVTNLVSDLAAKASAATLSSHISNTSNPHSVTAAQVGAYTTTQADAAFQPLDSDLTAIAALATTAYGRALLTLANQAALQSAAGLGSLALLNSITASLISDAPANSQALITAANYAAMRALLDLEIGIDVQAWDADLDTLATMGATRAGILAGIASWAQTFLGATSTAAARSALGLSNAAVQSGANGVLMEHFLNSFFGTITGVFEFLQSVSGTGASTGITVIDDTALGTISISTGTTTTGRAAICTAINALRLGGAGVIELTWRFYLPSLYDGTQTGALYLGFGSANNATPSDGAYLYWDNTQTNFRARTRNNNTETDTDVGVAPAATTWYTLKITVAANGASIAFALTPSGGSTTTVTNTTNLPTGSGHEVGILAMMLKSAGTSTRQLVLDFVRLEWTGMAV